MAGRKEVLDPIVSMALLGSGDFGRLTSPCSLPLTPPSRGLLSIKTKQTRKLNLELVLSIEDGGKSHL